MAFVAWPDIELLHNVRNNWDKGGKEHWNFVTSSITYRGKIKLHGNNAGISIYGSTNSEAKAIELVVTAQSRSKCLAPNDDLAGFSKWTLSHRKAFETVHTNIKAKYPHTEKTVIFGEWCGEGIQKNVALCGIKRKIFAVFSILTDDGLIIDPAIITSFFALPLPENLHIIPWLTSEECKEDIMLDYNLIPQIESQLPTINTLVNQIDSLDPWVKSTFQVEGPGEGVVWYPISMLKDELLSVESFERLAFKTKGEKHSVVKQAKPAQVQAEVAAGVPEFVAMFVTPGRCEQGVHKVAGDEKPTKAQTGAFCKWMSDDVKKESAAELEASGLAWKQVEKEVTNAARKWFMAFTDK